MTAAVNATNQCSLLFSQVTALQALLLEHQCAATGPTNGGGTPDTAANAPNECHAASGSYSLWLHIVAIFVILAASFIGTIIPVIGKLVPVLQLPPFPLVVGKCASTGVLLAVAMIHLISEAADGFKMECVPLSFRESYGAYAFLFAMFSAILMHAVELELDAMLQRWSQRQGADSPASLGSDDEHTGDKGPDAGAHICAAEEDAHNNHSHSPAHHHHSHSHAAGAPSRASAAKRFASALFMDFGVTLHSVFVGLTVGIASDTDTKVLLVALVFHQMFEGLALGMRLADASMRLTSDLIFALIFSLSAPVGAAIGTAVVVGTESSLAGTTFVMVRAIADSVCGGIMMYLGFGLMFGEFPRDLQKHAGPDAAHRQWKRLAMYVSLWTGAGLMAAVGKWA